MTSDLYDASPALLAVAHGDEWIAMRPAEFIELRFQQKMQVF